MPPLVSILIPVYNAAPWVDQAIQSALGQTWPNIEVIALDDASVDGSWDVISRLKEKVRVERAEQNGGQNRSRNKLTAMSSGEWLVYLDADDEMTPDAVEKKMHYSQDADCVYGTMEVQHYKGTDLVGAEVVRAQPFADPIAAAFEWSFPNTSSVMLRRTSVLEAGGWNEGIQNCTDYELYFRMLTKGARFAAAPESRTIYRQWSAQQAVNENPVRRIVTRLQVMWTAAETLESAQKLSQEAREAFSNAALLVIRVLFTYNPGQACAESRRLEAWNPGFSPSPSKFPKHYCIAHRLLGFRYAEAVAQAMRLFRRAPSGEAGSSQSNTPATVSTTSAFAATSGDKPPR